MSAKVVSAERNFTDLRSMRQTLREVFGVEHLHRDNSTNRIKLDHQRTPKMPLRFLFWHRHIQRTRGAAVSSGYV